jgi:prepilin-type N-terminal cleavage/methylation domain-containing protein
MTTNRYNRKGFTLAEAMIAVVLLAFAASTVSMPFVAGAAVREEGAQRTLAAKLAHDMTEEIVSTDFDQIIFTYDGHYEHNGMLENANGEFFTDPVYADFRRIVSCTPAAVSGVNLIWVTVYIYRNNDLLLSLSTLVGE